jgi:hypothetical protein
MQHADLLLEICREIMAKDPKLATMDAGPSCDTYGVDTKIHLTEGNWAFFQVKGQEDRKTFVYRDPTDIPYLYHRLTGKCPPGHVLVEMDSETRCTYAQLSEGQTFYSPKIDWMVQEYETKRDIRAMTDWHRWSESKKQTFLDERYSKGPKYMPVSNEVQLNNMADAAAHRQMLKDLEQLGYTDFGQVMTLLKDKRSEVLQEREFQIWAEGYQATGQSSDARLVGTQKAYSFYDACKLQYESEDAQSKTYWRPDFSAIWGCRLFDNEADARKSFG